MCNSCCINGNFLQTNVLRLVLLLLQNSNLLEISDKQTKKQNRSTVLSRCLLSLYEASSPYLYEEGFRGTRRAPLASKERNFLLLLQNHSRIKYYRGFIRHHKLLHFRDSEEILEILIKINLCEKTQSVIIAMYCEIVTWWTFGRILFWGFFFFFFSFLVFLEKLWGAERNRIIASIKGMHLSWQTLHSM